MDIEDCRAEGCRAHKEGWGISKSISKSSAESRRRVIGVRFPVNELRKGDEGCIRMFELDDLDLTLGGDEDGDKGNGIC